MFKILSKKEYKKLLDYKYEVVGYEYDLKIANSKILDFENQQEKIVDDLQNILNQLKQTTAKKTIIKNVKKILRELGVHVKWENLKNNLNTKF